MGWAFAWVGSSMTQLSLLPREHYRIRIFRRWSDLVAGKLFRNQFQGGVQNFLHKESVVRSRHHQHIVSIADDRYLESQV